MQIHQQNRKIDQVKLEGEENAVCDEYRFIEWTCLFHEIKIQDHV